jgi:hypothetical protein
MKKRTPLQEYEVIFFQRGRPRLPKIPMTPKQALVAGDILARSTPHGQDILIYLMEEWQDADHIVEPTTTNILLKYTVGSKLYSMAGLRSGWVATNPLIVIGWEGLRKERMYPSKAIDKFQSAVTKITTPEITESAAHIVVDKAFDLDCAKGLLKAMHDLAQAAHKPRPKPKREWDASLPRLDITVGPETLYGIQDTLLACESRVQELFAVLIQGWNQAGGKVHCYRPGRIYLKLTTRETEAGVLPWPMRHTFNLAVLAAPKGKRGPTIDIAWNLARGEFAYMDYAAKKVKQFEAVVSHLPGFAQQGVVRRIVIDDQFQSKHAGRLLKAMLALGEIQVLK